jgi:hypothetical protein
MDIIASLARWIIHDLFGDPQGALNLILGFLALLWVVEHFDRPPRCPHCGCKDTGALPEGYYCNCCHRNFSKAKVRR